VVPWHSERGKPSSSCFAWGLWKREREGGGYHRLKQARFTQQKPEAAYHPGMTSTPALPALQ
jgi:hypothetical protein